MRHAAWLLAGLWLVGGLAEAALRLELDARGLSAAERAASATLLDEAHGALPASLLLRLDRAVPVRWAALPGEVYGRAGDGELLLNRTLLPGLVDGAAARQATGRPHGTVRRELLATVLHEVAHLYDRAALLPLRVRLADARCRQRAGRGHAPAWSVTCQAHRRHFTLSDDPRLLELAGWTRRPGRRGRRLADSDLVDRSPDDYEQANPREFVAVNLEYFLLDPAYACRRPSLHRLFAEHFGWSPAAKPCPAALPVLNAGQDMRQSPLLALDPARVWQVDYLFAEANQRPMSRWGHSMLRLVICAPGRAPGPDCRLDLQYHLVLSFRAFIDDLQLSSWRGLTGSYPSRLFILPLDQVIDEYTKIELRGLRSVPLALSRTQIRELVQRSVELHWGYDGHYYFLSRNCAVETLGLLRAALGGPWAQLDSIMPDGLLAALVARGLADEGPLQNRAEARRLGYWFDSYRERYEAMFRVLHARLPIPAAHVEQWLSLPPAARRPWIERADLRGLAALLLLEQAAGQRELLAARDALKRRYLDDDADPTLAEADAGLRTLLEESGFLSRPAELLASTGYGIPQPEEVARLREATGQRQQRLQALGTALESQLETLLAPTQRERLAAIEANRQLIRTRLRALHRADGGLALP